VAQIVRAAMDVRFGRPPKFNAHLARRERELGSQWARAMPTARLKLAGILNPSAAFWHRSASAIADRHARQRYRSRADLCHAAAA
jgi:hypothetical protein